MDALFIVAALAAQVAPATSTTAPAATDKPAKSTTGQSTYVDLQADAGYSSAPDFGSGRNGSAFGRISVHAVHSRFSARSSTLLSAYADNTSYTGHTSSQQSANVYFSHSAAVSEHVRLFADAGAAYQEGGQLDTRVLAIPVIPPPTADGTVLPPILILPTGDFLSVTGRQTSFSGHVGGTFGLGPRDSLSLSTGAEHVNFRSGSIRTNYTTVPVSLAYDRQLSPRTTVGARVVGQDTEYNGPANTRVITPQLTARTSLAQRLSLDGAVGMSFARTSDGVTVRHSTGLSVQTNLCGVGETSVFCGRFSIDQSAATTAGPARSVSGGVDYSRRLDANQTIQLSFGVTHYSTPISVVTGQSFSSSTYFHAGASYSRRIGSRLFGGVNVAARKVTQNGPDRNMDFNLSLFLRYRFGDVQ